MSASRRQSVALDLQETERRRIRPPRYPKWRIEAYRRAQEVEAQARHEAYAIKRQAEFQAGER